jgi:hypothetical protein
MRALSPPEHETFSAEIARFALYRNRHHRRLTSRYQYALLFGIRSWVA